MQPTNPLNSREKAAAKAAGLKHYAAVVPCPQGHLGLRYVTTGICVTCHRGRAQAKAKADPAAHTAKAAKWNRANPEKHREYKRQQYARNPEPFKARVRDSRYLLNPGEYEAMLSAQGSRCLGCRESFVETPNVDHCHDTGKVRGLLCGHCNRTLAFAKDNVATLRQLADYLLKSREVSS